MEVEPHAFHDLGTRMRWCGRHHALTAFYPRERHGTQFYRRLSEPWGRSESLATRKYPVTTWDRTLDLPVRSQLTKAYSGGYFILKAFCDPMKGDTSIWPISTHSRGSAVTAEVIMDVIKMEPEFDPLAVQTNDDAYTGEANHLQDENPKVSTTNLALEYNTSQSSVMKILKSAKQHPYKNQLLQELLEDNPDRRLRFEDTTVKSTVSNCGFKWEIKIEETAVPVTFPVIKCEPEEETFDMVRVKQENQLELKMEESEFLTERKLNTDGKGTPQMNCTVSENYLLSETPEPHIYQHWHGTKNNSELQTLSLAEKSSFKCNICGKLLRTRQNQRKHLRIHTTERRFECDTCGKYFLRLDHLRSHVPIHTGEKPFTCDVCGKCFARCSELKSHARMHSGEKSFKCSVCEKCFVHSSHLRVHERTHSGEKPFKCDICGKCFAVSSYLKVHRRRHTGEKPFVCDVCGMSFVKPSSLTVHARIHSGERSFKCKICGRCYVHSGDLTVHARKHFGQKPFKCDVCGKCFVQAGSLTRHARTHSGERPFICLICGMGFVESGHLKRHGLSHSREKGFKCDVCGKCFAYPENLIRHTRTHSREKTFKCDVCGKSFLRSDHLTVHTRTHSGTMKL
ncbi:hypothetical protein ANN_27568 [Periplaneta americana]|uniref:C2H2-type domain-containing protein n=1 Tax=Periplaneta americana TaxID=6978 RepID=A0ABQ8RWD7_PERAM|nr:hypothetical protein ANN_27568 [Periplaneta americana]